MSTGALLAKLNTRHTLTFRIQSRPPPSGSILTTASSFQEVERKATAQRRGACAQAATDRIHSGADNACEYDLSDDEENDEESNKEERGGFESCYHVITVRTLPVASSIGGKIWDASLLLAAWIAQQPDAQFPPPVLPDGRRPRLLELGAGLGLAGLAAAMVYPSLHVTLSDNDPVVLDNLREAINLNKFARMQETSAAKLDVAMVDFRDFSNEVTLPRSGCTGLRGTFDMIIAADVVYESSHSALANLCHALLAPSPPLSSTAWHPCALFMLPDSRPRLDEFVDALSAANLHYKIERVDPSATAARKLRQAHEGWGAGGATFSLYHVVRS